MELFNLLSFICKLIENREELFTRSFHRIVFCQPENLSYRPSESFERLKTSFPTLELVSGLPDVSTLRLDLNTSDAKLLIIDDLQHQFLESPDMLKLLQVECHHLNISVIFTMQNFFTPAKFSRSISRNLNYKVFFYNRLDLTELRNISLQISPHNSTFLQSCFSFLVEKFPSSNGLHQYVLVDGHYQSSTPQLFVHSNIFPDPQTKEITPLIFFPSP